MLSIIRAFTDDAISVAPRPLTGGHIHDTYYFFVQKAGEQVGFVLQKMNTAVFTRPADTLQNMEIVGRHLAEKEYPREILRPVHTRDGAPFYRDADGAYWRMFPFFEGCFAPEKVTDENLAFEAACAFGEYLFYLKDLPGDALKTTIPGFHDGVLRFNQFKLAAQKTTERHRQAAREIQFLFDHQSLFSQIAQCDLPRRVTHHDTKINNILFDQKTHKARAIIDLDTLMPGTVLSDFGDMVRTFANAAGEEGDPADVRLMRSVYEAIRAGFLSEMKDLTATESARLLDGAKWITLMQAMRFLTDFLSGDVYYKTRFEGQNLRRAQNQIALFNQIKLLK